MEAGLPAWAESIRSEVETSDWSDQVPGSTFPKLSDFARSNTDFLPRSHSHSQSTCANCVALALARQFIYRGRVFFRGKKKKFIVTSA